MNIDSYFCLCSFRNLKFRFPFFGSLFGPVYSYVDSYYQHRLHAFKFTRILTLMNIDSYFCLSSFRNLKFRFSSSRLLFRLISYSLIRIISIYQRLNYVYFEYRSILLSKSKISLSFFWITGPIYSLTRTTSINYTRLNLHGY